MPKNRLLNPTFQFAAPGVVLPLSGFVNGQSYPVVQDWNYQQDSNGGTPPAVTANILPFPFDFPLSSINGEPQYYAEFNLTDTGSGIGPLAYQKFGTQNLNIRTLNGQQAILSFWANSSVNEREIAIQVRRNYGTGGSPSPDDIFMQIIYPLLAGWRRYALKFPILPLQNLLNPISFGTNNNGYLAAEFFFSAPPSILTQVPNAYLPNTPCIIDISQPQLEYGGTATSFDYSFDPSVVEAAAASLTSTGSVSYSGAGTSTLTLNLGQVYLAQKVNLAVGTGAYTRTINLSPNNAVPGAKIDMQINFPASTSNPTISIVDEASSAVIYTEQDADNAFPYPSQVTFIFDGNNWSYWG